MNIIINYLGVFVAAIVSMVIGSLWYSALFGKAWIKLSGFTDKQMKEAKAKGMTMQYIVQFIASMVMAYILAFLNNYFQAVTFAQGMMFGFWVWLGFAAPILLNDVLWGGSPFKLYLIKVTHLLVTLTIMAGIIAIW
ncbi:Uncharacterised protein [uncultured archaeon]|nr:Uncharacterised protein [uncultured archaeon]